MYALIAATYMKLNGLHRMTPAHTAGRGLLCTTPRELNEINNSTRAINLTNISPLDAKIFWFFASQYQRTQASTAPVQATGWSDVMTSTWFNVAFLVDQPCKMRAMQASFVNQQHDISEYLCLIWHCLFCSVTSAQKRIVLLMQKQMIVQSCQIQTSHIIMSHFTTAFITIILVQ